MPMYATRSTGIEIRITWCCGTGCWAFAAGGEGGAVGHGDMGSFPDGLDLKSPLGRRLSDGPPRHADV